MNRLKVLFAREPTGGNMRKLVKGADASIYSDLCIDILRLIYYTASTGA